MNIKGVQIKSERCVNMSNIKRNAETRCELAMMGKVQKCTSDEVEFFFNYIKNAIGFDDLYNDIDIVKDRIKKYTDTNEVEYITTYRLCDMPCICFLLKSTSEDEEEKYPAPFEEDYGTPFKCAFCYVFNLADDDMCSEFGDVFFSKKSDGFYYLAQ